MTDSLWECLNGFGFNLDSNFDSDLSLKLDLKVDSDETKNDGVEAVFENDLHYGNDVGFLIRKWGSNDV